MLTFNNFRRLMAQVLIWLKCLMFVMSWARENPMCFLSLCKYLCYLAIQKLIIKTIIKISTKSLTKKIKEQDEKKVK